MYINALNLSYDGLKADEKRLLVIFLVYDLKKVKKKKSLVELNGENTGVLPCWDMFTCLVQVCSGD